MPNGDSLVGEDWYNEIVIIPFPSNDSLYYIFVISTELGPAGLYYSVINMKSDSGRGDVIVKNIQLQTFPMVDCLTAIKHGNGRDWWLFFRKFDSNGPFDNDFHSYLITPAGISNYNLQSIGEVNKTNLGQLKFNKEGSRFVFNNYRGVLELFDFDRCNGFISNPTVIYQDNGTPPWPARISCEFSSNGEVLYVSTSPYISSLYQYDLTSVNILSTEQVLWTVSYPLYSGGFLKRGIDARIYYSCSFTTGVMTYPYSDTTYNSYNMNLSVINSPDSIGAACDFQPYSFYLGGKRTYWGLPNNPDYDLEALAGSPCDSLTSLSEVLIVSDAELFVYFDTNWQTAFINGNKLKGTKYQLEVFDLIGKSIFRESGNITSPYYTKNLNCSGFAKGMYVVNLVFDKERLVKRFVVR